LNIPVVLFTYLNPLIAAGDDCLRRASDAGVDGILVTDLPVGADPERESWLGQSGLSFIRLVAPTTPLERMREISAHGSGFVYLISRLGVDWNERRCCLRSCADYRAVARSHETSDCVGFGISDGVQAAAVGKLADGVVVGSALVKSAGNSIGEALDLTASLRAALDA
jgi:tryptophan synthase alpha chain